MDAPKGERKAEAAAQSGAKATESEVQATTGGSAPQAKRERAKAPAPPKSNGTVAAPVASPKVTAPVTGPEVTAPVADTTALEVAQAVAEVSSASLSAAEAAAEATVEIAQHALAIAEEQASRAVKAAVPSGHDEAAPRAEPGTAASQGAPTLKRVGPKIDGGETTRAPGMARERPVVPESTFFGVVVESAEASLRAALDIQTAALSASLSMLEEANAVNLELVRQWSAMAREAQGAALAAWQSSFRMAGGASTRN